jgi:hypothetical protein
MGSIPNQCTNRPDRLVIERRTDVQAAGEDDIRSDESLT